MSSVYRYKTSAEKPNTVDSHPHTVTEIENYLYAVAHELSAPLRTVKMYIDYLNRHDNEEEILYREYLKKIEQQMDRMDSRVTDLLALSGITVRKLAREKFSLEELTREVLADIEETFRSQAIEEDFDNPGRQVDIRMESLPPVYADKSLLRLVLQKLLENALKFTCKKDLAIIELGGDISARGASFYVKDNGVGFSMDDSPRLFRFCSRLHSQREYEGNGIGLSIAKQIVDLHEGRIWAEAQPGSGATFHVMLPWIEKE